MSQHIDDEIRRALKDSAAESLEGWEFSPAMQRKVLERIQGAETDSAPPVSRKAVPVRILRPLAWVAVAAATLAVAVNTNLINLPRMGAAGKESAPAQDAARKADGTTSSAPVAPSAPPGSETKAQPFESVQAKAPQQTPVPAPTTFTAPADQGATARQMNTGPVITAVDTVKLTLPDGNPPAMSLKAKGGMGIATAPPAKLHLAQAAGTGPVVELSLAGVRSLDPAGTPKWVLSLEGLTEDSQVAVSVDGRTAVSAGNKVYLISPAGEVDATLTANDQVTGLTWSPDGRLAVTQSAGAAVYHGRNAQFVADGYAGVTVAFAPDGALAVYGRQGTDLTLAVYDKDGARILSEPAPGAGRGLAFAAGGDVVVAGAQAYRRTGVPLWQAGLQPAGVVPAGQAGVLAWDRSVVTLLRPMDGQPIWRVAWSGQGAGVTRVVPSADGRYVAVLADVGDGATGFWVLDVSGKVLLAERMDSAPKDVTFVGDHFLLLTESAVVPRELSQH